MKEFQDPAADIIRDMQEDALNSLTEEFSPETDETIEVKRNRLFQKIDYRWRPEDKNALAQLRSATDKLIADIFQEAMSVIDSVYESVRELDINEHGVVKVDAQNRSVFKKNERGQHIEHWANLNGQDIEEAIFRLSSVKMIASQRVSELFLEAVFAKYVYDDKWNDSYDEPLEGTINDRESFASRGSRNLKYAAFFRYYAWMRSNDFLKEISQFMVTLEKIRSWRIRETER